jgi:hypothetical protein
LGRRAGRSAIVDDANYGVHLHGRAWLHLDLFEHAAGRCRNLGVDLVGGDFEQWLIALHALACFFQPLGKSAFKDRLAHLGHDHVSWHAFPSEEVLERLFPHSEPIIINGKTVKRENGKTEH